MSGVVVADRKATYEEVVAHGAEIRTLAASCGLSTPRVRDDGTVIVHSAASGYASATRLSNAATGVVGAYVHVITDDVPGAAVAREL